MVSEQFSSKKVGFVPALDVDNWEEFSRKITLGYYTPDGKWIPGTLEQMRDMTVEMAHNNKNLDGFIARDRALDRWLLRGLMAFALIKFMGFQTFTDILKLFGH